MVSEPAPRRPTPERGAPRVGRPTERPTNHERRVFYLALLAGLLAYRAGERQANATRKAAADQIAAIRKQMMQASAATAESDFRLRKSVMLALSVETSRIKPDGIVSSIAHLPEWLEEHIA